MARHRAIRSVDRVGRNMPVLRAPDASCRYRRGVAGLIIIPTQAVVPLRVQ